VAAGGGGVKVSVLYFGIVRERLGKREETVDVAGGVTVGDLVELLEGRYDILAMGAGSVRIACNNEYVDAGYQLHDGDEVAVIPPVSGG
jgi:molybdopterin converting factor subunit 1